LQDSNPGVRAQAARSLGQLGQAIPQVAAPLPQASQSAPPIADGERLGEVDNTAEQQVEASREQPERVEVAVRALADTPSKVDLLGFSVYAEALADFIVNEKTQKPLSIVIDAAWGMGKTTLMDMVKTRLEMWGEKTKERSFP
jgi:KAP family P-loop domain